VDECAEGMSDYTPIDCNLYDRYEAWATLRTPLIIEHRSDDGAATTSKGRITDLRNEAGAEWCALDTGTRMRLDHIISVLVDE
jgi:Rho-binding antiterminator